MSALSIQGIAKRFGGVTALDHVSLDIPASTFTCLLGPSGCGKTTLLRIIAGLENPDDGRVLLEDSDITRLPAHKRGLGMVFQSLALFPHLSVAENVGYGLKLRGVQAAERRARADELLGLVRLEGVADRRVTQLSGGQRQRVAMARALALEPKLFLLDEPLSALDAKLREEMQVELKELQRRLGVTTILVTHDQREAMTMGDLIVVMDHGKIRQAGAPLDVYRAPSNRFVAEFLGGANLLDGQLVDGSTIQIGTAPIRVSGSDGVASGAHATLCIRAEDIQLTTGTHDGDNRVPATIVFVRDLGHVVEVTADTPLGRLRAFVPSKARDGLAADGPVTLHFPPDACRVLAT